MRTEVARARLAALGLSQTALAASLGVELRTLQRWFAGTPTQLANAEAVARALGLGTAELFDGVRAEWGSPFAFLRGLASVLGTRESPFVRAAEVVLEQWSFLDTYISFASHPRQGHVRRLELDPSLACGFARFHVQPGAARRLVFGAYVAPRLRYDFGAVSLEEGRADLVEYFHTRAMRAPRAADDSFELDVWIPREMSELVVIADADVLIRPIPNVDRLVFVRDRRQNAHALCFRPAPSHLRQAGLPPHDDRVRGLGDVTFGAGERG